MDYIATDGKPVGFNTAVLAELARRANLDIELVQVDSGACFIALAAGRIDLFFWQTRANVVNADNYAGDIAQFHAAEDKDIALLTTAPYWAVDFGWLLKAR